MTAGGGHGDGHGGGHDGGHGGGHGDGHGGGHGGHGLEFDWDAVGIWGPKPHDDHGAEHFLSEKFPLPDPMRIRKLYASDRGDPRMVDPLKHLGSDRVEASKAAARKKKSHQAEAAIVGHFLALALLPAALFLVTLLSVGFFYESSPEWVLLVCGLAMVKSAVCLTCFRHGWTKWLGPFLLAASLAGTTVGLYYYYKYLAMYNHYKAASFFTNVAPSQNALLFEGSGMLRFTADTYVDRQRSVGYLSARRRETLCVAPVVDLRMGPSEEIAFFAAGVGCCHWRGSFDCDDADVGSARGGLLHFEPNQVLSPLTSWIAQSDIDSEAFAPAINLTQASFGLRVAQNVRLLRWAEDPIAMRDQLQRRALESYAVVGAIVLAALTISALCGAVGWKRISGSAASAFKPHNPFHRHLDSPA